MKRALLASVCIVAVAGKAQAQVAVIDPTGLVAQAKQLVETVKEETQGLRSYLTQLQQYATQLQTYATDAEMAANFIHDPSLGAATGLMNLAGVGNSLPVNPMAVMGLVNGFSGSIGGLTGSLGKLQQLSGLVNMTYGANHIYSPTDGSWASQQLNDSGTAVAGTQGSAASLLQDLQNHVPVLQALRDKLSSSTNMKDVADAQGAIQSEIAWTANTQAQLNAIQVAASVQQDNRVQRDNEALSQSFSRFATTYGGLPQ